MGTIGSFTPLPLCLRGKSPGTQWIGCWVGPRAGFDAVEKRFLPLLGIEPQFLCRPAYSQSLYWVSSSGSHFPRSTSVISKSTLCMLYPAFRHILRCIFTVEDISGSYFWISSYNVAVGRTFHFSDFESTLLEVLRLVHIVNALCWYTVSRWFVAYEI
jgi:hypothetical protein